LFLGLKEGIVTRRMVALMGLPRVEEEAEGAGEEGDFKVFGVVEVEEEVMGREAGGPSERNRLGRGSVVMKTVVEEEMIENETTLDSCANMHEGPGYFFWRLGEFPDFSTCWAGLKKLPEGMH
jgi:hypothetical protein